jgi:hypothetical protein
LQQKQSATQHTPLYRKPSQYDNDANIAATDPIKKEKESSL